MDIVNSQAIPTEELSLREFLIVLRQARWLIVSITVLAAVGTGIAALVVPKTYVATVLMAVATNESGNSQLGALGSLVSQVGGLTSLAGLSPEADSKKAETVAVLQSEVLTERYIDENHLLPILYAHKWDNIARRWKETDPEQIPTLWKANQFFKKDVRTVVTDSKTGLVTLKISWRNPELATEWANGLVKLTNDYLRKKAIDESERNIAYLTEQADKTEVVGVKQAIYTLMESEINKAMLARGNDEYAFKVLDPATQPERPSYPRPVLWVTVAVFASLLLSGIGLFGWAVWNKVRPFD
jgi:uncharacterized protein involved in exopolysaccharide biosynthesis